jgi:hypothetical protein
VTELHDNSDQHSAAEALVRAAAGYVRPSENLRPRVLEVARSQRDEKRALRRVWHLALVVLVLGMFTSLARTRPAATPAPLFGIPFQAVPRFDDSNAAVRPGEAGWEMVESFRELRRRQARLLRLAM